MTTNAVHTPFNDRCIIRTTGMQLTHKPVTDMQTVKSVHYLFIGIMLIYDAVSQLWNIHCLSSHARGFFK